MSSWRLFASAQKGESEKECRAYLHHKITAGRKILQAWREEMLYGEKVDLFCKYWLKRRILALLVNNAREAREAASIVDRRKQVLTVVKVFQTWKIISKRGSIKKTMLGLSESHWKAVQIRKSLQALALWLKLCRKGRVIQSRLEQRTKEKMYDVWREDWKSIVGRRKIEKCLLNRTFQSLNSRMRMIKEREQIITAKQNINCKKLIYNIIAESYSLQQLSEAAAAFRVHNLIKLSFKGLKIYPYIAQPIDNKEEPKFYIDPDIAAKKAIFSVLKGYFQRKTKADAIFKHKSRGLLVNIFSFWKEYVKIKNLSNFKVNFARSEKRRQILRRVFTTMCMVLSQERQSAAEWETTRLLALSFRGLAKATKRERSIRERLTALIRRKEFKEKKLCWEVWSTACEEFERDRHDDRVVKFIRARYALRRVFSAVQEKAMNNIRDTLVKKIEASRKVRIFRAWSTQSTTSQAAMLALKLGIRRVFRALILRHRCRFADYYCSSILAKKALNVLRANVDWKSKIKRGVTNLCLFWIEVRVKEFFRILEEQQYLSLE
jgi:hypothetical protein